MLTAADFPITVVIIAAVAAPIPVYQTTIAGAGTTYSQKTGGANHLKVDLPGKINQPITAEQIPLSNHIDPTLGNRNPKRLADIGKSLMSPTGKTKSGNIEPEKRTGANGNTAVNPSNYDGKRGERVTGATQKGDGSTTYTARFVTQLAARRD